MSIRDDETQTGLATRAIRADGYGGLSLQRCTLVETEGPDPGRIHPISKSRVVIGKSPDCDVTIPDVTVSRQHFEIVNEGGRYLIKDLGSTNGTELDGAPVREAYLRPGAVIKAGEVVFRFRTEYDPVHITPSERESFGGMIGRSVAIREVFALLEKVAPTEATVLLMGETGTGKGAAVHALHEFSKREKGPLVVVDCGAVAKSLIESELFGHVKGAFTGASSSRVGAIESSTGGTLFIDELDDLPLELQPKLLRAFEERVFVRLGSNQPVKFDARVVAASKKDLALEVASGRFREDLYYRLSVVIIRMPPLRERPEDIPLLFDRFAGKPGQFEKLAPAVRERWLNHSWPGNVRELRNAVERSLALDEDGLTGGPPGVLGVRQDHPTGSLVPDYSMPFKEAKEKLLDVFEREYVKRLMLRSSGGIAGAARTAGIDRKHLYNLLEKHGLGRPSRRGTGVSGISGVGSRPKGGSSPKDKK
ncbi:MAG: FHA domain-containing protein [Deltaproteobacteria bacterium]|nr:FHA domain-containing protein [Deltaproteobacteria bacterium]